MAQELGHEWGVHLKIQGSVYFICSYGGKDRSREYVSIVSPSKKRQRAQPITKMGCEFRIVTGFLPTDEQRTAKREKNIKSHDRMTTMVEIKNNCCFHHNHEVGKASLIIAKKIAGAYSINNLPASVKETLVTVLAFSKGEPVLLRGIMREVLPHNVEISESDIRNARNGALRAYLSGELEVDITQLGRATKESGLDGNAEITLGSDEAAKRAQEILLSTLQNSGETRIALKYLENLAQQDAAFKFEIATDEKGRPTGVWWQTGTMRKAWIRYGRSLYLDSMKRQMNVFHWPYIGPVVLTCEMKVEVVCECIIIEESLPAYAFVFNDLFRHGIRRPKESVGLIFGDCMLTDALLPMIGLSTRTTSIFYDQFHLMKFVWPPELGKDIFARVSQHASAMINSKSEEQFHSACAAIKEILIVLEDFMTM